MTHQTFPCTCPVCHTEFYVRPSLAMLSGINRGHGSCTACKTFLSLGLQSGGQRMQAIRFKDYLWKRNSGKAADHPDVAVWRADRLRDRCKPYDYLPLWAIRYALKQGKRTLAFLSALTFQSGAAAGFREEAVYQRDKGRRVNNPAIAARYHERAAVLDAYAQRLEDSFRKKP